MLECADTDPELVQNITGDENWVYSYKPEIKLSGKHHSPLGQRKHGYHEVIQRSC